MDVRAVDKGKRFNPNPTTRSGRSGAPSMAAPTALVAASKAPTPVAWKAS